MDLLSSLNLPTPSLPLLVTAALCLLIGYVIGNRRNKRVRRRLQRENNEQSLALLEAKSKYERVHKAAIQQARKDRLLSLALKRLKESNQRVEELTTTVQSQEKRHFMSVSRLRVNAVDANEKAMKAADIARKAMTHLRQANQNQSAASSDAVSARKNGARMVDQNTVEGRIDSLSRVTNGDSARVTRMRTSNKAAPVPPA